MEMSDITTDESIRASPHQVYLPGCFVVLQGIAGDGLPNTIESCPDYHYQLDEEDGDPMETDETPGAGDEVPPLEEDHFRPDANLNATQRQQPAASGPASASATATNTATATTSTTATTTTTTARMLSGNLVLNHVTATQNFAACLLNNPILPLSLSTGQAAAAQAQETPASSSNNSPPVEDDAFVVLSSGGSSEPQTPTRIRMYGNNNNNQARRRRKERAIQQWSEDIWERQRQQRQEWRMQQRQHHDQQQQQQQQQRRPSSSSNNNNRQATTESDWWLDSTETGYLALYDSLPHLSTTGVVVTGQKLGALSPGSTVMARRLHTLDSESLHVVQVDGPPDDNDPFISVSNSGNNNNNKPPLSPSIGCIQVLEVSISNNNSSSPSSSQDDLQLITPPAHASGGGDPDSAQQQQRVRTRQQSAQQQQQQQQTSATTTKIGYCVYSVHGYAFLVPGIPSLYMDPQVWWWRVTCKVGAYLRSGLELSSDHTATIPFGSFVQVTRKTVNRMGLSRLRVVAQLKDDDTVNNDDDNNNNNSTRRRQVEGWCSEFLNPLSGQRGHVVQPLPFPVPAVYRVTLPEGAVIREQVELSSRQIGHAPLGTSLTIVKRQFSEHPQEHCVERLKLAGGRHAGWISVRLNQMPPNDRCVAELVGVDNRFDPHKPGDFHWDILTEEAIRLQEESGGATAGTTATAGTATRSSGDISSIGSSSSSDQPRQKKMAAATTGGGVRTGSGGGGNRQQTDTCLICLTEERNATIVHGETGHIACCLVCARILKARGDRCPVCRLEIDSVIQHFWA